MQTGRPSLPPLYNIWKQGFLHLHSFHGLVGATMDLESTSDSIYLHITSRLWMHHHSQLCSSCDAPLLLSLCSSVVLWDEKNRIDWWCSTVSKEVFEYVLCGLLFRLSWLVSDWLVSDEYVCQCRLLIPQFCTLQTEVKTFYDSVLYIVLM